MDATSSTHARELTSDATDENSAGSADHVWEVASKPEVVHVVQAYEEAWRSANGNKPSIESFLSNDMQHQQGARLALLRTDMALRWEAGERVRVEWYTERYQHLDHEPLVALAYEEFCLREEHGEQPELAEYYERFPALTARLQRLFDIHDLVGTGSTGGVALAAEVDEEYPEVGETIGGFLLLEELGRGAFSRVYRAAERRLANRPVALKLGQFGSREPRTLARLQHTHIVPIHSYRTDASTGLQMLCMPYFGRVTLGRLLQQEGMRQADGGADILKVLDALDPEASRSADPAAVGPRDRFARLTFGRAIAQWGARLAEALAYAHEHGVVHGDMKPSNILITPDAQPMLLDFNLAQTVAEHKEQAAKGAFGGTFPYMAPEHLEALAGASGAVIDTRSDIFSLGVVLYEAMGTRPFEKKPALSTGSVTEVLRKAASQRRNESPRLRKNFPDVSPAFDAVVSKCLAAEPTQRYQSAAALAEDLQAIADDGPLVHAREAQPYRMLRWMRRHQTRLLVVVPVLGLIMVGLILGVLRKLNIQATRSQVETLILNGKSAAEGEEQRQAQRFFDAAEELALRTGELEDLAAAAREAKQQAAEAYTVREKVDRLFNDSGWLRFSLMGFDNNDPNPAQTIRDRLNQFAVFGETDWRKAPELDHLKPALREALIHEVDELLFFWAVSAVADARSTPDVLEGVIKVCDLARKFSESPEPWDALLECSRARLEGRPVQTVREPAPEREKSPRACFQWGLIHSRIDRDRSHRSLRWLLQSVRLDPTQYWPQYFLGYRYEREGNEDRALAHYLAAIALDPASPWPRLSRARLLWPRGDWDQARLDLDKAIELAEVPKRTVDFPQAYHERGYINQRLGNFDAARHDYAEVLNPKHQGTHEERAVRMNLAVIEYEEGKPRRALAEYQRLLKGDLQESEHIDVRLGQARVLADLGNWQDADVQLGALTKLRPDKSEVDALRAELLIARRRYDEALAAANRAAANSAAPLLRRLRNRAALGAGNLRAIHCDDPDEPWRWPGQRARLASEIRRILQSASISESDNPVADGELTACVLMAAVGDRRALQRVDRVVAELPGSARAWLIATRVHRALGDLDGARSAVDTGLELDPDNPRLLEAAGLLRLDAGDAKEALVWFDRAKHEGTTPTLHASRARAYQKLVDWRGAVREWTAQLEVDLEDPETYIARAVAARHAGASDQAIADLEMAIGHVHNLRPDLYSRLAWEYAQSIPKGDPRIKRVGALLLRAATSMLKACSVGTKPTTGGE